MWTFGRTVSVEQQFGKWYARVVLVRSDTLQEQGAFLSFQQQPTESEVGSAASRYALGLNLAESVEVGSILTRYQFRDLFTTAEKVAIDNYEGSTLPSENKAVIKTILKDLEAAADIDLRHPGTRDGVQYLEAVGLIAQGRAAEILGSVA